MGTMRLSRGNIVLFSIHTKWDNVWPYVLTLFKTLISKLKFLFFYFNLIFIEVLEERC